MRGCTSGCLRLRRMLTAFEREVLLTRAASTASSSGTPAPFRLRPGLIVEILAFYDELRRRDRTVDDFDRLMIDSLQSSVEIDRGAERLFRQTEFLTATFTRFESLVESSGRLDEHALRRSLLAHDGVGAYRRVVVSVADQAADPRGLWTADYDMLAQASRARLARRDRDRERAGRRVPRARARRAARHRRATPGRGRVGAGPRDAASFGRRCSDPLVRQPRQGRGARRGRARRSGRSPPRGRPSCSSARFRISTWRVRYSPTPVSPTRRWTRSRSPPSPSPRRSTWSLRSSSRPPTARQPSICSARRIGSFRSCPVRPCRSGRASTRSMRGFAN